MDGILGGQVFTLFTLGVTAAFSKGVPPMHVQRHLLLDYIGRLEKSTSFVFPLFNMQMRHAANIYIPPMEENIWLRV